jgi:uncharacterized membrane protein YdbT with pleckstrin-like domain
MMGDFADYLEPGESPDMIGTVSWRWILSVVLGRLLVVTAIGLLTVALADSSAQTAHSSANPPPSPAFYNFVFVAVGIVALIAIAEALWRVLFVRYALTGSRVLVRSLWSARSAELRHVQDVVVVQGVVGRLLGFGDVIVRTAGTGGRLTVFRIDAPHEWFRAIQAAVKRGQSVSGRVG